MDHYHYTIQPVTSGCTDTARSTVLDLGQICTGPKTIPLERTNAHNLHALYSIRKHTLHIVQIPLTVRILYCHEYWNTCTHIIDYGFLWPRSCWTCCNVVTGILLHFILFMRIHNIFPSAHFSDSWITPHTHSSQIHSHNTLGKLLSTSTFFVNIFTLTKTGEC